jgi:molybdopterin synthase sulfur carrier subunit
MSIQVRYFASLGDQLGRQEDQVQAEGPITVADVWQQATDGQPMPPNILMAVNQEYAETDQAVNEGDEVAFFPPVTGG